MKSAGKRSCWAPDFYKPCDYATKPSAHRQISSTSKPIQAPESEEFNASGARYTMTELFFLAQTADQLQLWGRQEERMFAAEEHTFALRMKKNFRKDQKDRRIMSLSTPTAAECTTPPLSDGSLSDGGFAILCSQSGNSGKRSRKDAFAAECVFALSEFKRGRQMFQDALKIYWNWEKLTTSDKCDVLSLMREARWCMSMARLDLLRMT